MGLRLTTKVQVSGWRFLLRRLEHAIVRRDTRMFDDPLQFYSRSVARWHRHRAVDRGRPGAWRTSNPRANSAAPPAHRPCHQPGVRDPGAGSCTRVFNLTSARLVLGSPAIPTTVKSSELSKLPMGQTIGIPGPRTPRRYPGQLVDLGAVRHRHPGRNRVTGGADGGVWRCRCDRFLDGPIQRE